MATLYVENVPDDLYNALRQRAKKHRKSIAAEVLTLLEQHVPTARELRARRDFIRRLAGDSVATLPFAWTFSFD